MKGVGETGVFLETYGVYALFIGFSLLGMGVPIPMLVLFGSVGVMVQSAALLPWEALLLVFAGSLLGDTLSYLIFYYGGPPLLKKVAERFSIKPEYLDRLQAWYRQYGVVAIIIIRWINWGEGQIVWLCGMTRMPFKRFFPVMSSMDFLWSVAWTYVGISSLSLLARLAPWAAVLLIALLVGGGVVGYAYYRRYYQRPRDLPPAPPGKGQGREERGRP